MTTFRKDDVLWKFVVEFINSVISATSQQKNVEPVLKKRLDIHHRKGPSSIQIINRGFEFETTFRLIPKAYSLVNWKSETTKIILNTDFVYSVKKIFWNFFCGKFIAKKEKNLYFCNKFYMLHYTILFLFFHLGTHASGNILLTAHWEIAGSTS